MAPVATELILRPVGQGQLANGKQQKLADIALAALGLIGDGSSEGPDPEKSMSQMREVMRQRGVKQRFADEFELKIGDGENVPENESEPEFMSRVILTLKKAEARDIVKALDRVEKNNRKAVVKDADFKAKQGQARARVARAEEEEKAEDAEFGTWYRGSPEEFAAFFDSLEEDFSAFAGAGVSYGSKLAGESVDEKALLRIQQALEYFRASMGIATDPPPDTSASEAVIKSELANWSPAQVISAYRKLSLTKHPDKGGSPEAFQELTSHAAALMEALGYDKSKRSSRKPVRSTRNGVTKTAPALCVEVPELLKTAMAFFALSEEDMRGGTAEIKRLRQRLGTLKAEKEKEIQRERDPQSELLQPFAVDLGNADLKQIKAACVSACRKHYTDLYTYLQKMK